MSDDFPVKPRSNAEIWRLAKRSRREGGVPDDTAYVDVLEFFAAGTITTVYGPKRLELRIVRDDQLTGADGLTTYGEGVVTVTIAKSVHTAAMLGEGRARQTLAHELGHAVMHDGAGKARMTGAVGRSNPKWLKPFESAEHQAKVFAAAFLINDTVAETLPNVEEIAVAFGISLQSAKIYFEEREERRNRTSSAERVTRMAAEFVAKVDEEKKKGTAAVRYANEICTSCGQQKLVPVGIKFLCDTCGSVQDRFQDGDTLS